MGFKNKEIIQCLKEFYGIAVDSLEFLPLGADFNTTVYRIKAKNSPDYFLKLRIGEFSEASVSVPKYLTDTGFAQVIAPIENNLGQLWTNLSWSKAILYPYIEGHNGVDIPLSENQWVQFGTAIKKLHSADIPASTPKDVPRETFSSKWRQTVKAFLKRIENEVFEEAVAVKMASFLKSKRCEIFKLIDHAEKLAFLIKKQPLDYVLCHGDIHGWNLIIDKEDTLYIVDWDTLIFAPIERDLMFIGAGIWDSGRTSIEEEKLFYKGYGSAEINWEVLYYYRLERIIQDIAECCEHIFLYGPGDKERIQSFEHLKSNFLPGGTIERIYQTDKTDDLKT